jgi:hypothetical protein
MEYIQLPAISIPLFSLGLFNDTFSSVGYVPDNHVLPSTKL